MKKIRILLYAVLVTGLLLAGCAPAATEEPTEAVEETEAPEATEAPTEEAEPIVIGVSLPLTGDFSEPGTAAAVSSPSLAVSINRNTSSPNVRARIASICRIVSNGLRIGVSPAGA